jgi:type I restriction enzyme S subunit
MTELLLRNSILQYLYTPKDNWEVKELQDVVDKNCPISYGIVQQGDHVSDGVPVVRPVDLHTKFVGRNNLKCTTRQIADSYSRTILNGNEILLCVRGTTGILALAKEELAGCNVNRGIVPIFFGKDVDKMFIYYQLLSPSIQSIIAGRTMGSALRQINIKDLRTLPIAIPPIDEQKKIAALAEEIMPEIDKYGATYEELYRLNAVLPEKLKKSILQEAIMGKLGTQNPNDEPASVLLNRIREEKKQLVKAGVLKKKDLVETSIEEDEIPFEIPNNWDWLRIGDLFTISSGLGYKKDDLSIQSNKMVRVLRGGNIFFGGWLKNPDDVFISSQFVDSSLYLKKNTFITPAVSSFEHMGKTGWIKEDLNDTVVGGFVLMLNPICHDETLLQYINYVFQSAYYSKYCQSITHKSGQAFYNISRAKMLTGMIPLPPLAEQHRIVEKIEALFAEVDHMKI